MPVPDALIAGALAGAAALSLPLGAIIALVFRPPARLVALIMGFGSGALIHAVVTELAVDPASEMVRDHGYEPLLTWGILAAGFLGGGMVYVGLNIVIEKMGGGLHWRHRQRKRALEEKRQALAPLLQVIARSKLAECLKPEEIEELLPFVRRIAVTAGQTVYRQGDASDGVYLVANGAFDLQHVSAGPDAQETKHAVEAYAMVGGLGMLSGEPRTASLVARSDGELLMLARIDFQHAAEKVPCLRRIVENLVTHELFVTAQRSSLTDAEEWHRVAVGSISNLSRSEADAAAERHGESSSPLAIFLGTLLDGIPESAAIGASFVSLAAFSPTFMVAVFLSNLPEAVGGTSALLRAKFSIGRIAMMWIGLAVGSALAGTVGYLGLHDASPALVAFLGSVAGGGVVAMLAMTMMPEAYESGHAGVAPATIVGFLASLLLAVFEMAVHIPVAGH
ncbi:MAG: cyclic nucleotide-binding domain-containing protein [Chloroflexi bacterium]|nr:cyclic nucleotide-binding domain-containing protein [Chloroflexota bacterium]